jgi:hypothetical protein
MKVFVISAAIAAAVFSASPAQADADSYLARLSANGVNPIGTMTPGNLVAGGLQMRKDNGPPAIATVSMCAGTYRSTGDTTHLAATRPDR